LNDLGKACWIRVDENWLVGQLYRQCMGRRGDNRLARVSQGQTPADRMEVRRLLDR
jgi:hypothetical protein